MIVTEEEAPLWSPSEAFIQNANLTKYRTWLQKNHNLTFSDYEGLWKWSGENAGDFWETIWNYFDILCEHPWKQVLPGEKMPETEWFTGTKLSYAEHLFRYENQENPALIFCHESGKIAEISWSTLRVQVAAFQRLLVDLGIKEGDRVAAVLPNIPEAIISFIAVNSLGAIWSCCSPDFGADTIYERFSQIEPKLLIACDGYTYNGKPYSRLNEIKWLQQELNSLQQTVFLPYLDLGAKLDSGIAWPEADGEDKIIFKRVPFDHPIWVLYSSGTTGKPKAITHSHGGVLLEHLKYMSFHNDVKAGENFFWFTTTGWMMWNFLQASMLVGATPVLFDGSPAHPDLSALWNITSRLPIHHFGTSAPYLTALMKSGIRPGELFNLNALRSIGSTGAPLPPEVFDWIYQSVKNDLWLCSMSGGTDVCTAFVGGCPEKPVYRGKIQCRALGCALYAYDENGNQVTGALGEMVIEKPMPSMPIYFWNDPDNRRYHDSYFADFPGKWRHGDFIQIFTDGSLIIQGRSDATLNRKGVRIGTAEIYNVLDEMPEIQDCLIINIEHEDGSDLMPLFVKLKNNVSFTDQIREEINHTLRAKCSPRHVPDLIIEVPDIPYTLSGKKMEVPVKRLFIKRPAANKIDLGAIRNPEAMEYFIQLAQEDRFNI
ncbi:MAG: acetoacetate--CoA ligase [Saprospiraceae bacterium]|nr:acetoacetate--CoA ligase [Saprospiraceae bacterium]